MLSTRSGKVNETKHLKILVLFPGSLGDFLCFLPALDVIRGSSPDGKIVLVARSELLSLARRLLGISSTRSLDNRLFAKLFSPDATISHEEAHFFSSAYEVLSWFGYTQPEVKATLNKFAPERVRSFAFFTGQEDCHASAYYLRCVGQGEIRCPFLLLSEEEKRWLDAYWKLRGWSASSCVLVLHPGSGGKRKRWEPEGFVQIARWWRSYRNRQVVVLLGPAEEFEEEAWRHIGEVEKGLSLWQAAALLSRADLYLGNDSGITHLAGSVGARGAALFGPTRPQQWRPLGGALSVVHNVSYRMAMSEVAGISLAEISLEEVCASLTRHGI